MSDWADKIAMAMFRAQDDDVQPMDVAELIRKARTDALEEAADIARRAQAPDGNPCEWPAAIAAAIRAAKDKPPKAC